ncbi:MAG TPA: hypothetical protein VE981_00380 [Planctomycetota bacterium]|nr:hypothetical protein [Planctomycetota bacterium]
MRRWLWLPVLLCAPLGAGGQDNGFKINSEVNQVKVEQAIARGIAFLKTSDSPDSAIGPDSDELKLLTFVHGGVPETDAAFEALLKKCLERKFEKTYRVSLLAMCLEEIDRVKYQDQIALCGQFLLDNIKANGGFSYGDPTAAQPEGGAVASKKGGDAFKAKKPPGPIDPNVKQKPEVLKHITLKKSREGPEAQRSDNSNSQYGALGIRACHDAGVNFPKDVIERCRQYWVNNQRSPQNADPKAKNVASGGKAGYGWCYSEGDQVCAKMGPPYGSMTAGAVGALCIYNYILGKDWKKDRSVLEGMNWLDTNYSVTQNVGPCEIAPVPDGWLYYYLYALERTGLLYDTTLIGKHDWYLDGYKVLLGAQKGNGSWDTSHFIKPTWDTCFAILFLKRSTRPLVASTVSPR